MHARNAVAAVRRCPTLSDVGRRSDREQLRQCHCRADSAAIVPWIYERRGHSRAPDLSMPRATSDDGARCRHPNKVHSHATERTRALAPVAYPYLNRAIVSHSLPSDILRRVIRYDTVRLFLQFSRSFCPSARYCSLVNFFS